MKTFDVAVKVSLKDGISDPQAVTIERSLSTLGFSDISGVKTGKQFWFQVQAEEEQGAIARGKELGQQLLSNPVIESITVETLGSK